jgi:hypothetical protein
MTAPGRLGQHTSEDAVSFRCAAYGEMAAVVKALPAGREAGMGPPLGPHPTAVTGSCGYFGGTAWKLAEVHTYQAVREILSGEAPTPPRCGASTGSSPLVLPRLRAELLPRPLAQLRPGR